jgi:hypothetical protein
MKKKIILTFTICLFAAGSIFNMHMAQNDQNMNFLPVQTKFELATFLNIMLN